MSSEAIDALEAWYATTRALREATPGSAEWVRLRMIAQEQHSLYEDLLDEAKSTITRSREQRVVRDEIR